MLSQGPEGEMQMFSTARSLTVLWQRKSFLRVFFGRPTSKNNNNINTHCKKVWWLALPQSQGQKKVWKIHNYLYIYICLKYTRICSVKLNGLKIHPSKGVQQYRIPHSNQLKKLQLNLEDWERSVWSQGVWKWIWMDQIIGAERSLVTVGRSLTVANGFPPLWKTGRDEWHAYVRVRETRCVTHYLRKVSRRRSRGTVGLGGLWRKNTV